MNAMGVFAFVLIFGLLNLACSSAQESPKSFNVLNYGAVGNGITDNSKNLGKIIAPASPSAWKGLDASQWLAFNGVSGLHITGHGAIDGRGSGWWNQSCRDHQGLVACTSLAPTAVKLLSCKESSITDMHFIDSPQAHILIFGCNGIDIKNLLIRAAETSPNTDGVHIQSSHNVFINNTIIGSGDDCVSIGDYTSNVKITFLRCGPGHGVSIGSLGKDGNFVQVENIFVSRVFFNRTTNGARIKTYQVGKGYVRNVTFEQIKFDLVENPIIIDQNYCLVRGTCKEVQTGVHISDVSFNNMYGTSSTEIAVNLNCSRSVPCTGILFKSIQLKSANPEQEVTSSCNTAHGNTFGVVQPKPCLQV
uniref:Polygalacturonase n=1 Tax=Fagus sylvatica TaxID=28930 RepID=A0A2N9I8G4_FAGSY